MEQTKLFDEEPFVKGNKYLAKTVILYADWIFYIDENLDVFCRVIPEDKFNFDFNDNHWYQGHDEDNVAYVLESDVEKEQADDVADQFVQYAYKESYKEYEG